MTTTQLTPKEVIELKKQNPNTNILSLDYNNIYTSKKNPVGFIPILIKRLNNDKPSKIRLVFKKQIIASGAKLVKDVKLEDAKHATVTYKK